MNTRKSTFSNERLTGSKPWLVHAPSLMALSSN